MIIDLTHTLQNHITVYPGTLEPSFEIGNTIDKNGFAELNMSMCTHTGTHMDAPSHILINTKSLDEFPLTKFIGKGVVVDCSKANSIELDRLKTYEEKIIQADFALFYTGWQSKWNTPNYFDEFPVLTVEATTWLLNFNLKALGFDAISVDAVASESLPNHHLLLAKEILIIENMTNLDKLIGKDFELNCIPLKIGKADGSPIRAFARM